MQSPKFYLYVAGVGALTDLAVNKYVSNTNVTSETALGLKSFYAKVPTGKAMLLAAATFVVVVLIADGLMTTINKK
jgi:hypothetical protein